MSAYDVNEFLGIIRAAVKVYQANPMGICESYGNIADVFVCVAELDNYLSEGGFLPDAWKNARTGLENS